MPKSPGQDIREPAGRTPTRALPLRANGLVAPPLPARPAQCQGCPIPWEEAATPPWQLTASVGGQGDGGLVWSPFDPGPHAPHTESSQWAQLG